jgi:hypothetical protein
VKGHKLFKKADYLIDNLCTSMLSEVEATGQEQSARAADPVPIWECVKGDIEERGDRWVRRSHLYEERKGGASHHTSISVVSPIATVSYRCTSNTVPHPPEHVPVPPPRVVP